MSRNNDIKAGSLDLIPLFPTMVWKTQLKPEAYEPLNEKIRAKLTEMMSSQPPLGYAHSFQTDQELHHQEEFRELVQFVRAAVDGVFAYLQVDCRSLMITGFWANVGAPGAGHKAHTHPNNFLSGVYYVQTHEGSNKIVFDDPRPQAFIVSPHAREAMLENATEMRVAVSDGTLVMFPAWLQHRVDKNESNENRISIAFNVMFSPETEMARQQPQGLSL